MLRLDTHNVVTHIANNPVFYFSGHSSDSFSVENFETRLSGEIDKSKIINKSWYSFV